MNYEKIVSTVSILVMCVFVYFFLFGEGGYLAEVESNTDDQSQEQIESVEKDQGTLLAESMQNETVEFAIDNTINLVTLSGSQKVVDASLAVMNDRCAYRIDWGDDNDWLQYENCADGFTHQYKQPGVYNVELSLYFLSETNTPIEYWSQTQQVVIE